MYLAKYIKRSLATVLSNKTNRHSTTAKDPVRVTVFEFYTLGAGLDS